MMKTGKAAAAFLFTLLALLILAVPAGAQEPFPSRIPLPDGFQPEGIAIGRETTFYVGSIPTGAIYRGDLRTGEGGIWVPAQEGRAAIGMDYDERTGYLFVAGGPTGQAYVYDGDTGETLAVYTLSPPEMVFINDVVVTRGGAYFTNSMQPVIYRVPLGPGGELLDSAQVETIELSGDYTHAEGFNLNGITAAQQGRWLIAVQSNLGRLYGINPQTGEAILIDLGGGDVQFGDGILLIGRRLYVVQNQLNRIAVVQLSRQDAAGQIVDYLLNDEFDVPTTIDQLGPWLYAVNARFGTEPTPETEYWVVKVPRFP